MRALRAMIIANLKMSLRNRAALFWNLIFPAIFIIIFGLVFGGTAGLTFAIGIVGPPTAYQERVMLAMAGNDAFTVSHGTEGEELMALRDGTRDVVLIFDAGQAAAADSIPNVTLFYDQTNRPTAQVAVGTVRQVLAAVAGNAPPAGNILERTIGNLRDFVTGQGDAVVTNVIERPVTTREMSFIDFFVPGILAMSIMNSGIIGLATSFVSYRERGILRRIKVTPFPLASFLLAKVLAQMIQIVLQALILVGLAWLLFGLNPRGNPVVILGAIIVGSLAFLAIGFAISSIARNAETAASYANLITFPMLFLSGVFFSVETVPSWLQPLLRVLPLAYLVDALRQVMTMGRGLGAIWPDLAVLTATFLLGLLIAVRFFRWDAGNP
ncbi:MAG: ABC transporter permease [Chloroflexota bacterium]|nr:ABC transporter permease [Chloroflexota bacterium]